MAYLFKRSRSPYWWIGFTDNGRRIQKSTLLRHSTVLNRKRAEEMCRHIAEQVRPVRDRWELWESWVPDFLDRRYGRSPRTLERHYSAWRNIRAFLAVNRIAVPRQLSRKAVTEFLDWRQQKHPEYGCYRACKNTALHELSLLGLIMSEAIAREFASVNPCLRLGDRPDPARVKPRITEAEHQRILEALKTQPEWMRTSYMIAYEQGCRFSETSLPLSDVDLDSMVIGFRTKGRKEKVTFFPLSERLVSMFKEMKRKGYRETFVIPRTATMQWHRFFKRIGLGHICFHCLRVTFVTRCEEAGLTAEECMQLVGHSSFLVHQRYRRMRADHPSVQAMRKLLA